MEEKVSTYDPTKRIVTKMEDFELSPLEVKEKPELQKECQEEDRIALIGRVVPDRIIKLSEIWE